MAIERVARLLRAGSRTEAITQVEASLREDFDAFHSVLVLIGAQVDLAPQRFVHAVPQHDQLLQSGNFLPDKWVATQAPALYVPACANGAATCTGF